MGKKKRKLIRVGRFVTRNKIIRKVGLDTDNSFSWMENEKLTWNYKPRISKKENFLHMNYVVFSELMNLLSRKYPNGKINPKEIFDKLKIEKKTNDWRAGENDLRIISVYYASGIDCISTNNRKDFQDPCNYLSIDLNVPTIIEPGSTQDTTQMLKKFYKTYSKRKKY